MSLTPEQVARVTPPIGSDWDIAKNRDHVTAGTAGKLTGNDLTATTSGRQGIWMEYSMVAGFPADHGTVAGESEMLALHNWAADAYDTLLYHYVVAGDSCTRADDPGYRWHCLAGHGVLLSQWERRPLAAALEELSAEVVGKADANHTHTAAQIGLGNVTDDAQLKASQLDTDATLSADSDTRVASQKAVRAFVADAVENGISPPDATYPTTGLVHHWSFTETTNTGTRVDSVGSLALAVKNGPAHCSGKRGAGGVMFRTAKLQGLTLVAGSAPNVASYTAGFSVAAWVYVAPHVAADVYDCIAARWSSAGATDQWMLHRDSPTNRWILYLRASDGTAPYVGYYSAAPATLYQWSLVAATVNNTTKELCMYVDGVLAESDTTAFLGKTLNQTTPAPLSVGCYNPASSSQIIHSSMMMSDLGIWNRPITAAEVADLWNLGRGLAYA